MANLRLDDIEISKTDIADYTGLPPEVRKAVQDKLDAAKTRGQ